MEKWYKTLKSDKSWGQKTTTTPSIFEGVVSPQLHCPRNPQPYLLQWQQKLDYSCMSFSTPAKIIRSRKIEIWYFGDKVSLNKRLWLLPLKKKSIFTLTSLWWRLASQIKLSLYKSERLWKSVKFPTILPRLPASP